jgi:hypothetical protein
MFCTDKKLYNRGSKVWPPRYEGKAEITIPMVQLKYNGNWNPEPLALQRFARLMGEEHNVKIELGEPIEIADLPNSNARIATLTGTGALTLDSQAREAIKAFVAQGGTLFMDAAGGSQEFDKAAIKLLEQIYGRLCLRGVSLQSDLYRLPGKEIERVRWRRKLAIRFRKDRRPRLQAVTVDGRRGVIYSREDVSSGLVGYDNYDVAGYDPEDCFRLMRNIVLTATSAQVAKNASE